MALRGPIPSEERPSAMRFVALRSPAWPQVGLATVQTCPTGVAQRPANRINLSNMRRMLLASLLVALSARAVAAKDDAVLVGVLEHGFLRSRQGTRGAEFKDVRLAFRRTPA